MPAGQTTKKDESERLAALETGYRNLGREIGGLRESFDRFASEIRSDLNSRSKVQWSPMIAAVAVVVTVMGAFAQGPIGEIHRNADSIAVMQSNRFTDRDGALVQAQLDKIWGRLEACENEDFKRPEAEAMRVELLTALQRLHDRMDRWYEKNK